MEETSYTIDQFVRKKGSPDKKFKIVGIVEDQGVLFYYLKEFLEGDVPEPSDRLTVVKYERLLTFQ